MVVGVDEAGQDEMAARVELLDRLALGGPEGGGDAGDRIAGDCDVDGGGLVPVRVRQDRLAAANDQRRSGRKRFGNHGDVLYYFSGMRSSRGGRKRSS